jgi:serine/threonine-protein phosphatase 5
MDTMHDGFSVDHDIPGVGKLCTVFSAPDYPQFVEKGDTRHNNAATFVRLRSDAEWAEPHPTKFTAFRPRPSSDPYYDITAGGSDEEGPDGELAREMRFGRDDMDDGIGNEAEEDETETNGKLVPSDDRETDSSEKNSSKDDATMSPTKVLEVPSSQEDPRSSQEDTEEIPSWPRSSQNVRPR